VIGKNILHVAIAASLCLAASLALNKWTPLETVHFVPGLAFLTVISFCFNLFYWLKKQPGSVTGMLLAGAALRFLLALLFLLVLGLLFRSDFLHTALHFLVHYGLFTALEIRYLSVIVKRAQPPVRDTTPHS
jgi:F0F1-type ATP synthase assembly protein I